MSVIEERTATPRYTEWLAIDSKNTFYMPSSCSTCESNSSLILNFLFLQEIFAFGGKFTGAGTVNFHHDSLVSSSDRARCNNFDSKHSTSSRKWIIQPEGAPWHHIYLVSRSIYVDLQKQCLLNYYSFETTLFFHFSILQTRRMNKSIWHSNATSSIVITLSLFAVALSKQICAYKLTLSLHTAHFQKQNATCFLY